MGAGETGIKGISLVCLSTPDQERAVAFYESIGFEKRRGTDPTGHTLMVVEQS